jgi:hypothetical protein
MQKLTGMRKKQPRLSPRRLAACRANIRKAHEANRRKPLSPARRAALARATEANRRNFRLTPARLRAMGANIRKMQAGSVRKFQMTEPRRHANLANLPKAWRAPRSAEGLARSSRNRLQHGLKARDFERTLLPFGEDAAELEALLKDLTRTFAPQDDEERVLVKSVAEAIWLRFRLFRAQARWVAARLKRRLREVRRDPDPDAKTTEQCAVQVMLALLEDDWIYTADNRLLRRVRRRLKALVRKRQGGDAWFVQQADQPDPDLAELEKLAADSRLLHRALEGLANP